MSLPKSLLPASLLALVLALLSSVPLAGPTQTEDTRMRARAALNEKLRTHRYFRDVEFELVPGGDGLVFVVQAPLKPDPAYAARIAKRLELAMQPTIRHFEARFTRPFGLRRAEAHPITPVLVLPTRGAMADYDRRTTLEACTGTAFQFDRELAAPVFHEEGVGKGAADQLRRAVAGPTALAWIQAYRGGRSSSYRWLPQGLAAYLANHTLDEGGRLVPGALSAKVLTGLKGLVTSGRADVVLHSVNELAGMQSWSYLHDSTMQRAERAGVATPKNTEVWVAYGRECLAFVTYLDGARSQSAWAATVADALQGNGDLATLLEHFEVDTSARLDEEFRGWLGARLGVKVPPFDATGPGVAAAVPGASGSGPDATGDAASAAEGLAADASAPAATATLADLDVRGVTAELDRATALALAAEGRMDEAAALLAEAAERFPDDPLLAPTAAWIERWTSLRDAFLAQCFQSGETVRLTLGEEKWRGKLLGREGAELRVDPSGGDEMLVPLARFDGVPIALALSRKEAEALQADGAWVRGIPLAFAGHERAKRTLRGAGVEAEELLEASEGEFEALRSRGRYASRLNDLARAEIGSDAAAVTDQLELLGEVALRMGVDPVLATRREPARAVARALLARQLAELGSAALTKGRVESLGGAEGGTDPSGGRRVRVRWDLRDESQAADLAVFEGLDWRWRAGTIVTLAQSVWKHAVRRTGLHVRGYRVFLAPVEVSNPVRVSMRFRALRTDNAPTTYVVFGVGLTSADGMDHVTAFGANSMEAAHRRRTEALPSDAPIPIQFDTDHEYALTFDGLTATHALDGVVIARGDFDGMLPLDGAAWRPFLMAATDCELVVQGFEVEGTEGDVATGPLATSWVEARLLELFGE